MNTRKAENRKRQNLIKVDFDDKRTMSNNGIALECFVVKNWKTLHFRTACALFSEHFFGIFDFKAENLL